MLSGEAIRLALQQEQIMNPSSEALSPLRQRMIEDMRMRKLELKTRTAYLRAVTKLATFL